MSRLRWPDSTNSVSDVPGTIHFSIGILPLTLLIVSAPLLRSRVLQKRAGTTLPSEAQLPA